jgi:hypothetical protein
MTLINSARMNKIRGGYSGLRFRRVFGRGVCRDRQNFLGSARRIGALDGAGVVVYLAYRSGSRSFRAVAARFFQLTDFCGFQMVDFGGVCLVLSVWFRQRLANASFLAARLLIGNLTRSCLFGLIMGRQGGVALITRPDRAGGVPPFATTHARYGRRGCAGQRFEKKAETGPSALLSNHKVSEVGELQFVQTGSGVRADRFGQKLAEKCGVSGGSGVDAKGVRGKVAGHVPSDVAVVAMLCGAVHRVN